MADVRRFHQSKGGDSVISERVVSQVLLAALHTGGDFSEVFAEDTYGSTIKMVNGSVEDGVSGRDFGVGIRIMQKNRCVYAYTNDASPANLLKVAREAAAALADQQLIDAVVLNKTDVANIHLIRTYPQDVAKQRKVEIMRRAHNAASNYDSLISQITLGYFDQDQKVLIANSDGLFVEDRRVRTRLMISAIASKDGEKQSGFYGPGRHMGFELFSELDIEEYAKEAARIAVTMVNAEHAPSRKMPVVIHNGFGGVIFHEACGHSLEATSVAKGTSVFTDKIGQKIASDVVTAVDDGTIPNAWGSQNIDDEGNPCRRNLLIDKGVLTGYLIDKLNGRRMNAEATGSSRRQSYRQAPTSRMTNTFICDGQSSFDDIIRQTEYGLFAKYMGGGSVNPATGEFNFAVTEGYLIENGQITQPVRGATLIGRGADVLQKIDLVSNNLSRGQGMCGSISGSIPTDVGQPTVRVSQLTVGGRKGE